MLGLDAVVIATPDHWHAAIAIDALNAGKDVYVEKPLTFRMEEGPKIISAARLNQRICQVGAQQRSGSHYIQARDEYLRTGKLGKISLVRTWWFDGGTDSQGGANVKVDTDPARPTGHSTPPGMNTKPMRPGLESLSRFCALARLGPCSSISTSAITAISAAAS